MGLIVQAKSFHRKRMLSNSLVFPSLDGVVKLSQMPPHSVVLFWQSEEAHIADVCLQQRPTINGTKRY